MKSYHPQAVQVLPAPTAPSVAQDAASTTSKSGGDEGSRSNVQSVAEYVSDIQSLLFRDEVRFLPRADYMDSQVDITSKMRTILVDWLIEVHMKYRLRTETLHLAINLVDRYLSRSTVMRKRLQLIGVVAMFIAAKFEEISPPEVRDWVYITDNAYTRDEVFHMECHMLTALSFHIVVPTAAQFFDFLQKANGCDDTHRALAQYILELGLLDIRMLQHTPSHVVSAALVLSNKLLKRNVVWPAMMAQESRHSEVAVAGCVEELKQLWEADQAGEGGQLRAVHKKFSCVERHSVAKRDYRNP
jgi:cyclin B